MTYDYDARYQLMLGPETPPVLEGYEYDGVGNRLSSFSYDPYGFGPPEWGPETWGYTYNSANQLKTLGGATYTYDNNGNTLTDPAGPSYTWDFENRLKQAMLPGGGGTVSFKYDPFGRRIYKSSAAGTTVYLYDGANIVEERNGSGAIQARYTHSLGIDEPLAMLRGSTTSYYHADGLGSITSLTNSSGATINSYRYDSYGRKWETFAVESVANPFQYTGREWDAETGLYYYRARYYEPKVGRFLSEDPVHLGGKDLNFYRYVSNGPVRFTDPSGLVSLDKSFRKDCQRNLERALRILKSSAAPKCNCDFKRIGDKKSLSDLLSDPNIKLHSEAADEVTNDGDVEFAYMLPGDKLNIFIRPVACRMGRWALARALVHELTHQTLTPALGQEGAAQQMEINCGFTLTVMPQSITVTAE